MSKINLPKSIQVKDIPRLIEKLEMRESIGKKEIDDLKVEFGKFMKNIRNISSPEELMMMMKWYRNFHDELESLITDKLRLVGNTFIYDTLSKISYFAIFDKLTAIVVDYPIDIHDYAIWEAKRNSAYTKLQRYSKIILDFLYEHVGDKSVLDHHTKRQEIIEDGIKIIYIGQEYEDSENPKFKAEVVSINKIKSAIKIVRNKLASKNLERALVGATIKIDSRPNGVNRTGYSGIYDPHDGSITMYANIWETNIDYYVRTMIHELGHRFQLSLMSKIGLPEWSEFYDLVRDTHYITDYAKTNPDEMWAEVFMNYVLDRPIPGEVKSKFMKMAGLK